MQASDGKGGTATQTISVTVTPVNDNNPVFTSPDTASVPENTTAVMTVTATDADLPAQSLTYSIVGGADQAKFSITSGGALSFSSAPNFEAPTDANGDNVYVVIVQASDGSLTNLQVILVSVTGVNDNNPVITSPTAANVPENTTAVMTVTATDADLPAQSLTFSIVGGADQAKFSITSGGALSFSSAPNFEAPTDANGDNVYVVIVQASDGGLTGVQAILVTVTAVNDNNPVFTSATTANVAENTTAVMTVTATDADLPLASDDILDRGRSGSSEIFDHRRWRPVVQLGSEFRGADGRQWRQRLRGDRASQRWQWWDGDADDQRHSYTCQRQQPRVHVARHGQRTGEHNGRDDRDGHRCGPAGSIADLLNCRGRGPSQVWNHQRWRPVIQLGPELRSADGCQWR